MKIKTLINSSISNKKQRRISRMKKETLKDIFEDWECLAEIGSSKEEKKIIINRLKREAIKHIKFLQKISKGSDEVGGLTAQETELLEKNGFCLFDAVGAYDNSNVIEYIKWANNIEEKDLK